MFTDSTLHLSFPPETRPNLVAHGMCATSMGNVMPLAIPTTQEHCELCLPTKI